MIFLTVGNWHKGFNRLVKAVDDLKGCHAITEEIIAQIGPGSYKPKYFTAMAFCSTDDFVSNIKAARVVITHAGIGTISQAAKLKKPVIVVPRKASLGEHFDDHQFSTAKVLETEGKVLVAYEISELPDKLDQAKNFVPTKGEDCERIIQAVRTFIEKIASQKGKH